MLETIDRTPSVKSIRIEKPQAFMFKPGQFTKIIFTTEGKYLSISCSPERKYIEFTKRITESDFSKWFMSLKKEEEFDIEGPFGNFFLNNYESKIAFIVGGIGITPVFSMLEDSFLKEDKRDFVLFYGNKSLQDIPFHQELKFFQSRINLKLFYFIEEMEVSVNEKSFFCGILNFTKIQSCLPDINIREVFLCGPPAMVDAINRQIKEMSPIKKVKTEKILGYK